MLQIQMQHDTSETDRKYAELIQETNQKPITRKRYPWQIPLSGGPFSSTSGPQASKKFNTCNIVSSTLASTQNPRPNLASTSYLASSTVRSLQVPLALNHQAQAGSSGLHNLASSSGIITRPLKAEKLELQHAAHEVVKQTGSSTKIKTKSVCPTKMPTGNNFPTKRTSPEEYHIPSLNAYIRLEDPWEAVEVTPNISSIFYKLCQAYFRGVPRITKYQDKASWRSEEFSDLTNFIINPLTQTVYFNRKTLTSCSRGNLINVIFHALIHIAVYETSCASGKVITCHDVNFMEIVKHFNEKLNLQIGTDHTFLHSAEDDKEFYCFQGIIVKCEKIKCEKTVKGTPPILAEMHQKLNRQHCEGGLHKVYKAYRTINNNIEVKHLVHSKFAVVTNSDPTFGCSNHQSTTIKPRELVDITNEEGTSPKVLKMTQVIDLGDSEFNDRNGRIRKIVDHFKNMPNMEFGKCPFCCQLLQGGLQAHFDLCLHFST